MCAGAEFNRAAGAIMSIDGKRRKSIHLKSAIPTITPAKKITMDRNSFCAHIISF
jgi:hypothetical protein